VVADPDQRWILRLAGVQEVRISGAEETGPDRQEPMACRRHAGLGFRRFADDLVSGQPEQFDAEPGLVQLRWE
jgi:hypothetical protein